VVKGHIVKLIQPRIQLRDLHFLPIIPCIQLSLLLLFLLYESQSSPHFINELFINVIIILESFSFVLNLLHPMIRAESSFA